MSKPSPGVPNPYFFYFHFSYVDSAAEKWPLNLWPFSIRKTDGDLKASDGLVHGLSIPDQTKQFVFAVRDPETQAVIYLLDAQNLSEQTSV
ncbi:hypothetical protein MRB53_042386 [Persea americana]|nr:hypothetical protein MRB53_042386 [Persea americana]